MTVYGAGIPWWSHELIQLLPKKTSLANLDRGRSMAREGLVGELDLQPGRVAARVGTGGRSGRAALQMPTLDESERSAVLTVLAGSLRHTAAIADGQLALGLGGELEAAGVALLPEAEDVRWDDEIAGTGAGLHCVALVHAFAAAAAQDPFLLFELRGLGRRDEVLGRLRRLRAGDDAVDDGEGTGPVAVERADDYYTAGDLDEVHVHPQPLGTGELTIDRLGAPPRVDDVVALEDLVIRAAATAWKLAAGEGAGAADDEVLLAELRAARMATGLSLAETLGWDPDDVVAALERLYADGTVLRTGTDASARYRAT